MKEEKKRKHRELVKEYKKGLIIMDFLAIMCILLNFGAVYTTNYLVAAETDDIKIVEANPVVADIDGFETNKEANKSYFQFIRFLLSWAVMIISYVYIRMRFYNKHQLIFLVGLTVVIFFMLGMDFANNLGYFMGIKCNTGNLP